MTVLTIRACKRYATRQSVRLRENRGKAVSGLLIELSSEGCRISNLGGASFTVGQPVTLEIGGQDHAGHVRWARDGVAGLRLDRALHTYELSSILEQGRAGEPARLYGT